MLKTMLAVMVASRWPFNAVPAAPTRSGPAPAAIARAPVAEQMLRARFAACGASKQERHRRIPLPTSSRKPLSTSRAATTARCRQVRRTAFASSNSPLEPPHDRFRLAPRPRPRPEGSPDPSRRQEQFRRMGEERPGGGPRVARSAAVRRQVGLRFRHPSPRRRVRGGERGQERGRRCRPGASPRLPRSLPEGTYKLADGRARQGGARLAARASTASTFTARRRRTRARAARARDRRSRRDRPDRAAWPKPPRWSATSSTRPPPTSGPPSWRSGVDEARNALGAQVRVTAGDELADGYPLIAAVGAAATPDRAPRLIELEWGKPERSAHRHRRQGRLLR